MATADTVTMGPAHPPRDDSIKAFREIEVELKRTLQHLRHSTNKHEPEYFAAVNHFSDHELTKFSSDDLKEVRLATSAYGLHLLGKVLLSGSSDHGRADNLYFMFRAFIPGDAETATLHCIRMDEIDHEDGNKTFRAIYSQEDPLVWFDI